MVRNFGLSLPVFFQKQKQKQKHIKFLLGIKMSGAVPDIKTIAIQMEMDGINFYNDMAGKTMHPLGKAMFRSFVEDEKLHLKRLRLLLSERKEENQGNEKVAMDPRQRLATIFKETGEELREKAGIHTNDIEAVRIAMGIEEKGIGFYEKAAREANDEKDAETYRFLAEEEKTHFNILKNTLEFLEKNELWEAENEGRIYDMWMDMVNKKLSKDCTFNA
ncbi:MAG: ferritin-like domain-containing protein [Candidatus Loosdrechtia sp.]|uniref:ferritin-like domain-containing protein n=1 Tax=Candidatus Loosdrechtia sp. TaxID=3101272 RepID=UPI003A62C071|nr:MAG: ferritin family protein [Candidatus Jettenia sp. AMX2]